MSAPIVFFDIAGPDSDALESFYSSVFDWDIGPGGTFSTPVAAPALDGAIRKDPAGNRVGLVEMANEEPRVP